MDEATVKHLREGIVLIQDYAWEIIPSTNYDSRANYAARIINSLCNQFIEKFDKMLKHSTKTQKECDEAGGK